MKKDYCLPTAPWKSALFLCLMAISPTSFGAGFDSLFSALKSAVGGNTTENAGTGSTSSGQSGSFGADLTESYCRKLFSVASIGNGTPISEDLISEEFKLNPRDFFDAMSTMLNAKKGYTSYTFPTPYFYQGEFETDKVNVLYNLLLSYPSPQYMGALIAEARKTPGSPQYDKQASLDATVALAVIHFHMQKYSRSPDRWKELVASMGNEEHYTAYVVRARQLKSGEGGRIDATAAITLSREANGLRNQYSSENLSRTMSPRNYQVTSNQTLYETLLANPRHPDAHYFQGFMQKYGQFKTGRNSIPELKAQLGPGLERISRASSSATTKASQMLNGTTGISLIKAQKASLDSAMRTRTSDIPDANVDARAMANIAHELEKVEKFDERQKQIFASALADAHESGDQAISMMPTMMGSVMSLMLQRGMESMPAILPYSKALQTYSDNACTVIARWDHAAELTRVPTAQDSGTRSSLASLVADTGK